MKWYEEVWGSMDKDKTFTKLQAAFTALVAARAKEKGFKKRAFACKVWPELSVNSANGRWAALRKEATNKPQGLLLVDAFRLAEALGENPLYLIGKAAENAAAEARLEEITPKPEGALGHGKTAELTFKGKKPKPPKPT